MHEFVLALVWLLLEVGGWVLGWRLLANTGLLGAILVVSVCALGSSIYVLSHLYRQIGQLEAHASGTAMAEEPPKDVQLTETLIADLQTAYEEERWEEVIKIGSVLSRPLWVTGKYRLRVELGRLVEAAAAYSHRPGQQASALIDDLGWTQFVLGEVDEAKTRIDHGIRLAELSGNFHLACKGTGISRVSPWIGQSQRSGCLDQEG